MYDITGEIAEIGFMGYAVPNQKGSGLWQRQYARAFIINDGGNNSVVYVSIDFCMGFQMVKYGVIDLLTSTYGDLYTHNNVMISGTHTHATPGGVGGTALVDITTFGFIKPNYDALTQGIYQAIVNAHNNLQPGNIKYNIGQCDDCNINRSPSAYELNPDGSLYENNTDHMMTVLRFEDIYNNELGMIAFFAVHGTSLNNTNTLVSGDNKGYASYLFEQSKNPYGTLPGQGKFIAAFGQSNEGDVSPNTKGAICIDTGLSCDYYHSTCNGTCQNCIASGPGKDMYDSMMIIGERQYETARELYETASNYIGIGVDYRYQYVDMEHVNISSKYTSTNQDEITCQAAMGYAFAAGTTDGPGDFDFIQNQTHTNPFWSWLSGFLAQPTQQQIDCHQPKPILLDVGQIKPIPWTPTILPEQVFRIGNLWILGVPGEFTTMSGRRLRNTVQQILIDNNQWYSDSHIVIAGLSNSFSHYVTTYEEYQQQRYEGASTLYGPHTLAAHQQNFANLIEAMVYNQPIPLGPLPLDMRNNTWSYMPGVVEDNVPLLSYFGAVVTDVKSNYHIGDTVSVVFQGASPRNNLQTGSSFLFVDYYHSSNNEWITIAVDGNIETTFYWERVGVDQSLCTVEWIIPNTVNSGTYRIRHQGVWKALSGTLTPYNGVSSTFTVS